ncbi:MAG TPA: TA system VapC family ribonuclease toxin [Candidatus Acidoferrales bacterium]|jgi:toxin-antitoxin system PIN domain toxin|nr:TA system VapC family ribonuclease toxin [Candidatus Acidoferrales bacterium]
MIVLDANLLLYAYDSRSDKHENARHWLEDVLSDVTLVGLPWQTVGAFIRIATHPRIPGQRFTIEEVVQVVDEWLEQPNVRLLVPGDQHWPLLRRLLIEGQARGPLATDAQLAALTIENGGVLHTTDRDFARFSELQWTNPIEEGTPNA